MNADVIKEIERIVEESIADVVAVGDENYISSRRQKVAVANLPTTDPLYLQTLQGIVDVAQSGAIGHHGLIAHVERPDFVSLISDIFGINRQREVYAVSQPVARVRDWGRFTDLESFVVFLQSMFVQDDSTAQVLKLLCNIKDERVSVNSDDGVSQQATVRVGIAKVDNVVVPNPVVLAPFRTFQEVNQPASRFVLRLQSGAATGRLPTVALFESDGGAWQNEAMKSVRDWLTERLPAGTAVIG